MSADAGTSPVAIEGWRRGVVLTLKGLTIVCVLVVTVWVVVESSNPGRVPVRDVWVQGIGYVSVAALCAARPLLVRTNRAPWALLAAALACRAGANIYNVAVLRHLDPKPSPSWADAGWLAMYVLSYAAVVVLLRQRGSRWTGSTWLDGLICGAGTGAVAAMFAVPLLDYVTGTSVTSLSVGMAYPIADVAILALLATGVALQGWRPSSAWVILAGGLLIFALNDLHHLWNVVDGRPVAAGHLTQPTWLLGATVMAWAAWSRQPSTRKIRAVSNSWYRRSFMVPMIFGVSAIGLLVTASQAAFSPIVVWLAGVTLVLVLGRTLLALVEVGGLAAARLEAGTDDLTGLANRRAFQRGLSTSLAPPARPLTLLLIDLDRFKDVNDSLGHTVGDELLCLVSRRLEQTVRAGDLLSRLGGDEFAIVIEDVDGAEASRLAERLVAELRRPFQLENVRLHIDASIGIAHAPHDATDPVQLLRRADVAMYQAKAAGGGYAISSPFRDAERVQRFSLAEDLRQALVTRQLDAWFQPQIDLRTGAVVGLEALVRWQHREKGLLLPDAFLPLALATGLMQPLTEHMLSISAEQLRRWRDEGLALSVAVNIDAGALLDASLADKLEVLIAEHGLPANAVTLEITEDSFITNRRAAIAVLVKVRALGLRVSLDDYGTGYSSLSYLRDLPIDEIKIDRSFVHAMETDQRTASIVASTIDLANRLGICVVAEGIESEGVRTQLSVMGCDVGQGYLFSRPRPAEDLRTMLRSGYDAPVIPA